MLEEAINKMLGTIERLQLKNEARSAASDSTQNRHLERSRVEHGIERKATPTERYAIKMAESRAHATRKRQRR